LRLTFTHTHTHTHTHTDTKTPFTRRVDLYYVAQFIYVTKAITNQNYIHD